MVQLYKSTQYVFFVLLLTAVLIALTKISSSPSLLMAEHSIIADAFIFFFSLLPSEVEMVSASSFRRSILVAKKNNQIYFNKKIELFFFITIAFYIKVSLQNLIKYKYKKSLFKCIIIFSSQITAVTIFILSILCINLCIWKVQ